MVPEVASSSTLLPLTSIQNQNQVSPKIEVVIVEVNTNPPVFEKDPYEVRVREDTIRYSRVMTITANDVDTGMDIFHIYTRLTYFV